VKESLLMLLKKKEEKKLKKCLLACLKKQKFYGIYFWNKFPNKALSVFTLCRKVRLERVW
jgi:hypothetical protein